MAFVLYKGIEWRRRLTVTDSETGARTDLTGKTLTVQVRRRAGEPALIDVSSGVGITHLTQAGSTLGQADVVIAADLSAALEVAGYTIAALLDGQVVLAPLKLPVRAL
jgi:hypothetical protein